MTLTQIGPVPGLEPHVGLGFYPTTSGIARWDSALWDAPPAVWVGPPDVRDISCDVIDLELDLGRDRPLGRFRPATCDVTVNNPDGFYSPWAGQDLYGEIRPGIMLTVWALSGVNRYQRFTGIVDQITDEFDPDGAQRVKFTAVDFLSLFAAYDGLERTPEGGGELAGARLERIAQMIDYPYPRAFDAGTVTLQATNLARNALDEAGITIDTELGALWSDRDGRLQFRDRNGLGLDPRYLTPQAVFGEIEPELCYAHIELVTDPSLIRNDVSVSRAGGTAVHVSDQDSITLYGDRTYRRFDLIHESDAESTVIANAYLDTYAYAEQRIESLTVDLGVLQAAQPGTVDRVLALEPLCMIRVFRRAVGFQVVADLQIQSISEQITAESWTITFKTFRPGTLVDVAQWDVDVWDTGRWGY